MVLLDDIYLNEAMDRVWGGQGAAHSGVCEFFVFFNFSVVLDGFYLKAMHCVWGGQ